MLSDGVVFLCCRRFRNNRKPGGTNTVHVTVWVNKFPKSPVFWVSIEHTPAAIGVSTSLEVL